MRPKASRKSVTRQEWRQDRALLTVTMFMYVRTDIHMYLGININLHLYATGNCSCIYRAAAGIIAVDHWSASATVACHLVTARCVCSRSVGGRA